MSCQLELRGERPVPALGVSVGVVAGRSSSSDLLSRVRGVHAQAYVRRAGAGRLVSGDQLAVDRFGRTVLSASIDPHVEDSLYFYCRAAGETDLLYVSRLIVGDRTPFLEAMSRIDPAAVASLVASGPAGRIPEFSAVASSAGAITHGRRGWGGRYRQWSSLARTALLGAMIEVARNDLGADTMTGLVVPPFLVRLQRDYHQLIGTRWEGRSLPWEPIVLSSYRGNEGVAVQPVIVRTGNMIEPVVADVLRRRRIDGRGSARRAELIVSVMTLGLIERPTADERRAADRCRRIVERSASRPVSAAIGRRRFVTRPHPTPP